MSSLDQKSSSATSTAPPNLTKGIIQRGLQVVAILLLYGVILFLSAGRLDWPAAWYFLAIDAMVILVNSAILLRRDPAFIAARGELRQDAKDWDTRVAGVAGVLMVLGLIVPGLDLRFRWSTGFPLLTQLLGFIALITGYVLFSWGMISNRFFETKVRIQTDRGHTVATAGPYRCIRHPGYVGMILQLLGTPLALASWWGIIPALGAVIAFIIRTALEDRTLQRELPGYSAYAQRVRYRLLPGIW